MQCAVYRMTVTCWRWRNPVPFSARKKSNLYIIQS